MSREMKDSGIPWIGEIPKDWGCARMKQIGKYVNGYAFKPEDWSCSGKPIIRIQDLTGSNNSPNYYEGDIDEKYLIKDGDILVSWAATLDAFIWNKGEGWLNQHIFKAIPNTIAQKDFFFWLLKVAMVHMNNDNKHGIVMQHLTTSVFGNFIVPIPHLSEQQKIAEFLDKKCSETDEMIALQEQIIEELKAYKQSVITEAVTKGLNPNVPMKDSGIDWITSIPTLWKIAKIKNVISLLTDYDANGSFADIASNVKVNVGTPYAWMVRATDLANNRFGIVEGNNYCDVSTFYYLRKSVVHSGDVLIAKRGEIGKVYLVPNIDCPMTLAPNTYLLKLKNELINNRYFYYALTSEIGKMQLVLNNKSTAIGAIYKDDVKGISLPLPPLTEQQTIADYLDKKCGEIDALISIKQQKIENLKEYKKSIIYEYVTGKKEVE